LVRNSDGEDLPDSFWKKMLALGDSIRTVWESGECPDFDFDISDEPASLEAKIQFK